MFQFLLEGLIAVDLEQIHKIPLLQFNHAASRGHLFHGAVCNYRPTIYTNLPGTLNRRTLIFQYRITSLNRTSICFLPSSTSFLNSSCVPWKLEPLSYFMVFGKPWCRQISLKPAERQSLISHQQSQAAPL